MTRRRPAGRKVEQARIDARAADLAVQGLSMSQIAARMGWRSPQTARHAIDRHLALSAEPVNEALRRLWGARIEESVRVVWEAMHAENLVVSQGKVMTDPRNDEPLIDRDPNVRAADTMMRLGERAARLFGLDAPKRSVTLTVDMMRSELMELGGKLGFEDPLGVAAALAEASEVVAQAQGVPEDGEEVAEGEIVDEGLGVLMPYRDDFAGLLQINAQDPGDRIERVTAGLGQVKAQFGADGRSGNHPAGAHPVDGAAQVGWGWGTEADQPLLAVDEQDQVLRVP